MTIARLIAVSILALAAPVVAQEVIVTTSRADVVNASGGYGLILPSRPVIALRRPADFIVMSVKVAGDTRDMKQRRDEMLATSRAAISAASKAGVELSIGEYLLVPLTVANSGNLSFSRDGRPDTDQTNFFAKVRVGAGIDLQTARERIARFVASVRPTGRTTIEVRGEPTLSMIQPDQYRAQIIDLIAADATVSAAKFGPTYGVDVAGLDRPVEWTRAGPIDVFLYLPAAYTVRRN